jgi:DUF1680 family protein
VNISLKLDQAPAKPFTIFLRLPGWSRDARLVINGKPFAGKLVPGSYASVQQQWKKGDQLQLILPMNATLIEANPLVEETRNQVTVKRGPVVYCLESPDLPKSASVFSLAVPEAASFKPVPLKIGNSQTMALEGKLKRIDNGNWSGTLYKEVPKKKEEMVTVRLIPYYAWGNRGHSEMTVWMPYR